LISPKTRESSVLSIAHTSVPDGSWLMEGMTTEKRKGSAYRRFLQIADEPHLIFGGVLICRWELEDGYV